MQQSDGDQTELPKPATHADTCDAAASVVAEPGGKKKKRNRRKLKKAQDSVTNELLNNLDTDDLVDFINNCGAKKDDIKKTAAAQGPQSNAKKAHGPESCSDQDRVSNATVTDQDGTKSTRTADQDHNSSAAAPDLHDT